MGCKLEFDVKPAYSAACEEYTYAGSAKFALRAGLCGFDCLARSSWFLTKRFASSSGLIFFDLLPDYIPARLWAKSRFDVRIFTEGLLASCLTERGAFKF
jgi:hypothetical protein